jgi:hypothetical protein
VRTTWRKHNSLIYRGSNSDSSVVQSVASRYTDCAIPAPHCSQYKCESKYYMKIAFDRLLVYDRSVMQFYRSRC